MNPFIKKPSGDPAKQGLKLKILGVGGAGCKIAEHLQGLAGDVEFFAINADVTALNDCGLENRFAIGSKLTGGLGTGGDPERGKAAALEDAEGLESLCQGADIVFVLAGLGGGTGTGAAPLVAATARKLGALALSFVTLPFDCEGTRRQEQAELGLRELQQAADGVVCLPNQKVFK
ncbi:MAG: cell division protein FtsZ, partial [Limisphaerales bacterium]